MIILTSLVRHIDDAVLKSNSKHANFAIAAMNRKKCFICVGCWVIFVHQIVSLWYVGRKKQKPCEKKN